MKTSFEVANAPIATANSSAAAVMIRPVRSSPIATARSLGMPLSRASLIRESRKTRVVGGEAEGDREEQDRLGRVERASAVVVEQPLETAVLEDQHQHAEDGAEGEEVHHHAT